MVFTVVGSNTDTINPATDPELVAVSLEPSTQVGDMLVVSFYGGSGFEVTDPRLTVVDRPGISSPYNSGAYGVATDLSDVEVTVHGYALGFITVVTVRDYGSVAFAGASQTGGMPGTSVVIPSGTFPDQGNAVVTVSDVGGAAVDVGDDAGWITQEYLTVTRGADGSSQRVLYYDSGAPVPGLTASYNTFVTTNRSWFYVIFGDAVASTTTYLRQRQSPVRAPSRIRPPQVRQRQRPEVTT